MEAWELKKSELEYVNSVAVPWHGWTQTLLYFDELPSWKRLAVGDLHDDATGELRALAGRFLTSVAWLFCKKKTERCCIK